MPLAGKYRVWRQLFWLHDRYPSLKYHRGEGLRDLTPADGLPVTIAQYSKENDPASQGIAIREIRLYAVTNPASLQAKVNLPPADLPRRHTLWREEMADGVIASKQSAQRGVDKPLEWFRYKANLMQALAIDTYCKDLLEFGHCQHWDPSGAGGHQWYYYNEDHRKLWDEIVGVMSANGFQVFPYYEYAGSHGEKGLGIEKRAKPLKRDDAFTHISWIEYANADLTDPDTLADFKKLVDQTLGKYAATAKAAGIWIRPRSQLPMGFGENALTRFTRETKQAEPVTRTRLIQSKELYQQYRDWWFDKRREFLVAVRDYVREQTKNPQAVVLFTTDASEPGNPFPTWNNYLATDQPDAIGDILRVANSKREKPLAPLAIHEIVKSQMYAKALTSAPLDWGDWEISHANPPADPDRYQEIEGVLLTHGFNRAYTVADAATMQRFTTRSGLAITRHYSLNEHMLFGPKDEELLGYVCTDMEYAGPHCMFAEVQAMAQGDPRYITYLSGATYNRGYPEYVRQFNQAFLALPAIPSEIVTGHSDPDIVVRRYQHPRHGTWWAVINPSFTSKAGFRLPGITTPVRDVITGVETTSIDLLPCQLRTFHQR